ncbi:hypothetical protein ES702_01794 [subsurface metagenome]
MSSRGIEIHDGHIIIPAGEINKIHMGTELSPITQQVAGQVVISAVIEATLGGAVRSGKFVIIATIDQTAVLIPLTSKVVVNTGVTVTATLGAHHPAVFGGQINVEVLGTGIVAGRTEGLRIEMSSALGSETQSAFDGIFITNYNLGTQSANNYHMMDMRENGTYTIYCFFYLRGGVNGVDYFAELHGDTDAWHAHGAPATQDGWIRLWVGGLLRWIRLYTAAP